MKKRIMLVFLFSPFLNFAQIDNYTNDTFEMEVKIENVGNHYVACGTVNYSVCFQGKILTEFYQKRFGKEAFLYISCPDTLNSFNPETKYFEIEATYFSMVPYESLVYNCIQDTTLDLPKLRVLKIKKGW